MKHFIGVLVFLAVEPLFGATLPTPIPAEAAAPLPVSLLNEVLVTGSAAGQMNNDTSSISSSQAQDLQIGNAQSLNGISPNLTYQSGGDRSFNGITGARGLVNSFYFTDPALTFYVDDVPYAFPFMNRIEGDSIENLEILKGPQGSTFGQNGPAGIINVTQYQPTDYWTTRVDNDYGSYDHYKTFEQTSGPVGKDLEMLASFHYDERDGYLRNVALDNRPDYQEEIGGRFALRWAPYDRLSFDLNVEQEDDDDGVQRLVPIDGPQYQISSQMNGYNQSQSGLQSLKTTYEGEDYRVLFITSHRSFNIHDLADFGFGGAPMPAELHENPDQYTQELRIESKDDAGLKWSGGASWERVDMSPSVFLNEAPGANAVSSLNQDFDSYALYGQVEFKPAKSFSVQIGNRLQLDDRSGNRLYTAPAGTQYFDSEDRTYLDAAPKVDLTYDLSAHDALFASTGLTFRPGGYAPFSTAETLQPYGTEKTWANSVGWRAEGWEKRCTASLTLFWNETYDYQLEQYSFPTATVVNAPEVASRGVEWNLEIKPVPELTLQAQIGYTLATFDDFRDATTGQNYQGNRVPYVPEGTLLLAATYRHPLGWMAHLDYRGFGETYSDETNNPLYRQDAYGLLAAKIGYEAKHWSLYFYGENLTSAQYETLIASGLGVEIPGDPRTIGVGLDLKW